MQMSLRNTLVGCTIAIGIIALDQWTKYLVSNHLVYNSPVELLPVLDFTLRHNPGAAFSIFAEAGGWQRWLLGAISTLVSVILVVWISRLQRGEQLLLVSLAMILGGAVGNLWDRIQFGYVVDFISVHYQGWYFPAFNIADSAISVGAGLMILDMILNHNKHRAQANER